jgi:hypothetical protein
VNSSPLLDLPNEVLEEILSHLDLDSLFNLSTCSQLLFYLCRNRIVSLLKSQCGRLAGTSLICVGDYLAPDDYPPGIDWRSEMEELQKRYQEESGGCSDPEDAPQELPSEAPAMASLYDMASDCFSAVRKPRGGFQMLSMSLEQFSGFQHAWNKLPHALHEDLLLLIRFDHHEFYANGPEWVLRNLTTKEYVRRSVVAYGSNGPFSRGGVGLGEVLLSRICWSSDSSTSMSWDGIHRGIWAGHKFDITLMDALEGEVGWKDVSKSAYEEIKGILMSEYGEDWEKEWRGEL